MILYFREPIISLQYLAKKTPNFLYNNRIIETQCGYSCMVKPREVSEDVKGLARIHGSLSEIITVTEILNYCNLEYIVAKLFGLSIDGYGVGHEYSTELLSLTEMLCPSTEDYMLSILTLSSKKDMSDFYTYLQQNNLKKDLQQIVRRNLNDPNYSRKRFS